MADLNVFLATFCILFFHSTAFASDKFGNKATGACNLNSEHNSSVLAYADWPFRVDCDHLEKAWKERNPQNDNETRVCRLYHKGVEVTERIFTLANSEENNTFTADLFVNNTRCLTGQVLIDVLPFPNETCQVSRDDPERLVYSESVMNDQLQMYCGLANGGYPDVIPKGADKDDFKTTWITDHCTRTQYRSQRMWRNIDGPDGYGDTLDMPNMDFWDAINFTCSVEYKGKTIYPVTYSNCMRQRTVPQPPSLTCVTAYDVPKHGEFKFDCSGQMTSGLTNYGDFKMLWKRDDKILCENSIFEKTNAGVDDRFSCVAKDETKNASFKCVYNDWTPSEDIQSKRKKIVLNFGINGVKAKDFGSYSAVFMVVVQGQWKEEVWSIQLKEDLTPYFEMLVKVLTAVLAVVIALTAAGFFLWKYRIYILVAYKRSRLWKCDRDDKEYMAYISCHYDRTDKSVSSQYSATIVTSIHEYMDENHYNYFDEQRDATFGAEVERITNLVEKCHRMVLVLTPKYLEDRWRRFHAELGFHGQLESGMGLVLIVTPGVKKLLAKKAKNDKVWNNLTIALKTNRVIQWTEAMSADVLKKHIEYGMPKLERRKPDGKPLQDLGNRNQFNEIDEEKNENECVV